MSTTETKPPFLSVVGMLAAITDPETPEEHIPAYVEDLHHSIDTLVEVRAEILAWSSHKSSAGSS